MFIAFRLKQGRDDDLIDWITNAGDGDRSYHIREAIRKGLQQREAVAISPAIKITATEHNRAIRTEAADLDAALDNWL